MGAVLAARVVVGGVDVDPVAAGFEVGAEADHHEHRRHPERDHDGRQHQRLRQRVGVDAVAGLPGSAAGR
jgi:hypothetical protein